MLHFLSWGRFLTILLAVTALYYAILVLLFYRRKAIAWIRKRRTAIQDLPIEPLNGMGSFVVTGDSAVYNWTGFVPFVVPRDKELVLEAGDNDGGRVLELVINHRELLNAKDYGKAKRDSTE